VARHIALGQACLSVVTSLIHFFNGHMLGWSFLTSLILDRATCS
jgi:hypothetical protein